MGILERIVGRKVEVRRFSLEQVEPFFKSNGVDIKKFKDYFPEIERINEIPTEAYDVWFEALKSEPLNRFFGQITTKVSGRYCSQAVCSQKIDGLWMSGQPTERDFEFIGGICVNKPSIRPYEQRFTKVKTGTVYP